METKSKHLQLLIQKIKSDPDFGIVESEYSAQFFGNYLIRIKYKDSVTIEIVNDRSKIETDVLLSGLLSAERVPLAFIEEELLPDKKAAPEYVCESGDEAYDHIVRNKNVLDAVMDKSVQKTILRKWKRKRFL